MCVYSAWNICYWRTVMSARVFCVDHLVVAKCYERVCLFSVQHLILGNS